MPVFGNRSKENLAQCHYDLQKVFNTVIKGIDCSVICGHRGEVEQNKAYAEKKSQVKYPNSKHNSSPSMAADVCPYPIDWNDLSRFRDFGYYVIGVADALYESGRITHKVRWGSDWDSDYSVLDTKFKDWPHFELYKP